MLVGVTRLSAVRPAGAWEKVGVRAAWSRHRHAALRRRPGPRRSRGRRRRAPPPAWPRRRRSRSRGTRRRRSTTQLPSRPACSISGLGTRIRPAESSFSSKEPPWKRRRRAAGVFAEGAVRREEAVGELLELGGRVHPDAGVEALGENHSVGERAAKPRWHGQSILAVQAVLVEAPKCHLGVLSERGFELGKSWDRSDEVGGASPPRSWASTRAPL